MSTGMNCEFIKVTEQGPSEPDKWYYILENGRRDGWDWRTEAYIHGHFWTEEEAYQHLSKNYANPGGSTLFVMTLAEVKADPVLNKLIFEVLPQQRLRESAQRRGLVGRRW